MKTTPTLSGFGSFVPSKIITNQHLETLVDTTNEWIMTRTGIEERRQLDDGMFCSDLALSASQEALKKTGLQPSDLTHVIYATCTPDAQCPPASCILGRKLGLKGVASYDVNSACTGFLASLDLAGGLLHAHPKAVILVVAAEALTLRCNWTDRGTCILFGDGAGATIMTNKGGTIAPQGPKAQVIDTLLASDGDLGELLVIGGGFTGLNYKLGDTIGPEYFIQMQGRDVFKFAVRSMASICKELLEKHSLTIDDIDVFVPHQANLRIIEAVGSRLNIAPEKVFINVHKYGNTSAASIPLALAEALNSGAIKQGNRVLLTSFGGGFTWGATLLQF